MRGSLSSAAPVSGRPAAETREGGTTARSAPPLRPAPGEDSPVAAPADALLVLGLPMGRPGRRHRVIAASFAACVLAPTVLAAAYLGLVAADRYGSRVAFSIRSNETAAPLEILGAVTRIGGSSVLTDGQVLYEFIRSQQIVETIRSRLPLEDYYNRVPGDRVFALGRNRPIEDVVRYWNRAVDVSLDPVTGIVSVEARAFDPEDAQAIAAAILGASADLVNRLAAIAREDAVRHAADELAGAEQRLRTIRARLRAFRDIEQEVDPAQNARVAVGLVATLEEELARARVELDLLRGALDGKAPRIALLERQVHSLESRIAAERGRLGAGARPDRGDQRPLSDVVGEYEELVVDREFAEQAYKLALATYQQAEADARQRHRYLAPHIEPTLSEEPEYPDRPLLTLAVFLSTLAAWSVLVLGWYNLRDRG